MEARRTGLHTRLYARTPPPPPNNTTPSLKLGYGESQMLDKLLYEEEVKRCAACYEQQFHYAVFYAYMKLREQEIRNVRGLGGGGAGLRGGSCGSRRYAT